MVDELEIFDKQGAATEREHLMYGQLRFSRSGYLQLKVPNAIGRGVFDTLQEPGVELPVSETTGQYNAHVTVFHPHEVEAIGPENIQERGGTFAYSIGRLYSVEPKDWKEVSKVWCLEVLSPDLAKLRRTYGLTSLPQTKDGEPIKFHITVGIRRKGVLNSNVVSRVQPKPEEPKGMHDVADGESKEVKVADEFPPAMRALLPTVVAQFTDGPQAVKFGSAIIKALTREGKRVNTEPTPAQAEAGNYQKGHVRMHGLDITIENPKGSTRSGVSPSGKKWSVTMKAHYGYIRGTVGRDDDHLDCFVGDDPDTELVYVVDQVDPDTGKFDEHKAVFGCRTKEDAKALYLANYAKDWKGLGDITGLTLSQFKEWIKDGDTTEPLANDVFQLKTAAAVGLVLRHGKAIRLVMPE